MKKKLLTLLLLPAFLMAGCDKGGDSNIPSSSSSGGLDPSSVTPESAVNVAQGFFDNYSNGTSHNRIKTLAEEFDGIELDFRVFHKLNDDVVIDDNLKLGRKGNVVWAEDTLLQSDNIDPGVELPCTVKGALQYVSEPSSFEAYYGINSDVYSYYGTALREDINFSIQDIEDYFALSDYLLVYLIASTAGYFETVAGRKALTFPLSNVDMQGNQMTCSGIQISFDWETRLIMHYNYWFLNITPEGVSQIIMTDLGVTSFRQGSSVVTPTLVK